jgi:hypothetical protein
MGLEGTSADATARADILNFLRVLHRGGQLRIIDTDRSQSVGTLGRAECDLAFLGDVATLEEWAGMGFRCPSRFRLLFGFEVPLGIG